jgi:signal transduction histidine kinase
MKRSRDSTFQRRLRIAALLFAVFILFDLGLFGWLIFNSLSQRELDSILLPTREGAEEVARQLESEAEGGDLFTAMATQRRIQILIDEELMQQDLVAGVEVINRDGIVVFRTAGGSRETELSDPVEIQIEGELPEPPEPSSAEADWPVNVRIGELGFVRIEFDRVRLEERIAVLRSDLIRRISVIGGVTVLLLLAAFACIYWLLRRARRLEEHAAEAERMAYVGTLAAGLAHEIRNPLNALSLNMQMLEEDPDDSRLLHITRGEIGRLDGLVTDFLSYARPRPLEPQELPAVELLQRVAEVVAGELRVHGVQLTVRDDSDGARVSVDPEQMRQLLLNLVKNSLAALDEELQGERPGEQPAITLTVAAEADRGDGGHVVLEVADNGTGMTDEERERAFEIFYSTRKGGTGLGLAVVERIATAHRATVEVQSTPGQGTRVRLRLPRVGGRPESTTETGRHRALRQAR